MKKAIISVMVFILGISAFSQNTIPGPKNYLMPNSTVTNVYIPPDPDIFSANKVQTADIVISQYDESTTGHIQFPNEAKDALDFALMIWANTITSSVQIKVRAGFAPFSTAYPAYGNALAVGSAESWIPNFGASDPKYQPDTWYPFALASKMAQYDISPSKDDIVIVFNSKYHNEDKFYYATDGQTPDDKYDFVTVALHELCHALGFASSARKDGSNFIYQYSDGTNDLPLTYDRFIVNGGGTLLTSFTSNDAGLSSFLTSNNLFFNGTEAVAANGGNVRIYAPTTWNQGGKGSISHLDESFNISPYTNALMNPGLDLSIAIHNPGPVGVGIMNDIGWEAVLFIVGIYDEVTIKKGGPIPPTQDPITTLNIGSTYNYQVKFDDYPYPSNYIVSRSWKLEVRHTSGEFLLHSNPNAYDWQITLGNLPPGYKWLRNINGQVRGIITLEVVLDDGDHLYDELPVSINYKPDKPEVSLRNNPTGSRAARWGCSSVKVSFHANGATSYLVHYKKTTDLFYLSVVVPNGWSSYTFTGLDESKDYMFQVEAINSAGGTLSDELTRRSCLANVLPASPFPFINQLNGFINEAASTPLITAYPNPCFLTVRFNITSSVGALIQRVELKNIAIPSIGKTIQVNPPASFVDVPVWDLPLGLYSAIITDTNNFTVTLIILKI